MAALRLIKKYPNRRLYDTRRSRYIVLADIRALICAGDDVQVIDSQSGSDITRAILLQIVADREAGPDRLFTTELLIRLVRASDEFDRDGIRSRLDAVMARWAGQAEVGEPQWSPAGQEDQPGS
ncbi:MAG TPA: polyhydroxyalkanoate synthesis repressor PhaR [Alphaproteobacteria bacterium]|nr:polyhydroxyalkanoate synthesis repressor PhaR [Alphaproteobacteria bacterium]